MKTGLERNPAPLGTYAELKRRVRETLALGRKRAEEAVEQEKVRTAWEVGQLIQEHILLNQKRAGYGQKVLKRLSADLGISHTELKYMLQFSQTGPIGRTSDQLTWGQIQSLLAVNDDEKREELIKRAAREGWTVQRTRSEVKKLKAAKQISVAKAPAEALLVPRRGKLVTYRIVIARVGPWKGKPALDLGFSNYYNHPSLKLERFKEGDVVTVGEKGDRLPRSQHPLSRAGSPFSPADLFTYRAYPFKITDGDTLWVLVDLGFGFVTQQHLRLRGIDAPEIKTRAGQRAKRFVERELEKVSPVTITSSKSDKYDRYLADIFYSTPSGEKFLNNELLQARLAVRAAE